MPNKNGYEATREIRDMEGDLKCNYRYNRWNNDWG
jgi:hypothetical protein